MAGQRLTRDMDHAMLGGVCSGIARCYDFDVTLVRVVTVLLTVATGGIAIPLYGAAWVVMPRPEDLPAARPFDNPERLGADVREVGDRLAEAARVLADKAREAAEEISEIARRARTMPDAAPGAETPSATGAPDAPAAPDTTTPMPPPEPPVDAIDPDATVVPPPGEASASAPPSPGMPPPAVPPPPPVPPSPPVS